MNKQTKHKQEDEHSTSMPTMCLNKWKSFVCIRDTFAFLYSKYFTLNLYILASIWFDLLCSDLIHCCNPQWNIRIQCGYHSVTKTDTDRLL